MQCITPETIQVQVRYVNYFQAAPGAAWMHRIIPDFEFIYCISGIFVFENANGSKVEIQPGEMLTIFPGELHSFYQKDNLTPPQKELKAGIISCIHGELAETGTWLGKNYFLNPEPERVTQIPGKDQLMIQNLCKACEENYSGIGRYRQRKTNLIATQIIVMLAEQWERLPQQQAVSRIDSMILYIRNSLEHPITRNELSDQFNLSPEYISRLFTKHTGLSVCRYIQTEKMIQAIKLLHEKGLSIKETAFAVGYEDPAYFSRVFKQIMSMSPSELLQSQRGYA